MSFAIAIINRNLPDMTDELHDSIAHLADEMYVVENGSDPDKRSKHANVVFDESNGVSFAVNNVMQRAIDDGHEFLWVNYNDVWFDDPDAYVAWSKRMFTANRKLALTTAFWPNVFDINAQPPSKTPSGQMIVSFFDPISFIVSLPAVEEAAWHDTRLGPFWDSTNYPSHYNILAPAQAFYELGYFMACDKRFVVQERDVFAGPERDELSLLARGFTDEDWKKVQGPKHINSWMKRYFPDAVGANDKAKRNYVMIRICSKWHANQEKATFID